MTFAIPQTEAARAEGFSDRHMRRLIKQGAGPKLLPNGNIDLADYRAWIAERVRREAGVDADGALSLAAERARLTRAQADKAEYEAATLAGELVRTAAVAESWGRMISAARARLLSMPTKVAPLARAARSDADACEAIRREVYEALSELARDPDDDSRD